MTRTVCQPRFAVGTIHRFLHLVGHIVGHYLAHFIFVNVQLHRTRQREAGFIGAHLRHTVRRKVRFIWLARHSFRHSRDTMTFRSAFAVLVVVV